ncbi:glycosyltransferase [Roseibium sp. HPY-6]|uniref:glycosyltransferase n=1 Tax=Roseibium sp. HPY-6 TaxID=3229852 RepID=UPI00338DA10F
MQPQNSFSDAWDDFFLLPRDLDICTRPGNRLDVLHVTAALDWPWPLPGWFAEKSSRWCARLSSLGYNARALVPQAVLPGCSRDDLIEIILRLRPRMVVSRAFALRGRDLERLALEQPDVLFLQSNHTPNSFLLEPGSASPEGWLEAVEAARRSPSVYLSSVGERDIAGTSHLAGPGKILWIANPCDTKLIQQPIRDREDRTRLSIGLGGRSNHQKNLKNQLDAVALVARTRPVELVLFLGHECAPGIREGLRRYAHGVFDALHQPVRIYDFVPPHLLSSHARAEIDIFLQGSFDESFGYLNWEMMAAGVPTLTSNDIEVPGTITANPVDIVGMSGAILQIAEDLPAYREAAIRRAQEVALRNNRCFDRVFESFLGQMIAEVKA